MQPDLAQWQRHDALPDGTRVFLRPLRPDDGALYPEFARDLTADDVRLRFFAPISELSDARIHELTHLDYDTAMAFIALEETTGRMLGVVRLHLNEQRTDGEFAVIVRSYMKGHGLGWLLMQRIIEYARAIGLGRIHGEILTENTTMLRMCGELGFRITESPQIPYIKMATLDLGAGHEGQ